jgi:hypothetical protein
VQRPKDQGGHGIIDLAVHSKALLLKHLHKIFNKVDVPWVDLTWKVYYSSSLAPQARGPRGPFPGGEHCAEFFISTEATLRLSWAKVILPCFGKIFGTLAH